MDDATAGVRALLDLLLPTPCAGCGAPGTACCWQCAALLGAAVRVYPRELAGGPPAYALARYAGPVRAALIAYKERGRRALVPVLGARLAAALAALPEPPVDAGGCWWLVPAPSRRAAALRRGGQHVTALTAATATALAASGRSAAVAPALRMGHGVRDSVGLDPAARRRNLAGRVRVRRAGLPPSGAPVVFVDDVLTTGSTAAECTAALRHAGVTVHLIVGLAAAVDHAGWQHRDPAEGRATRRGA